MENQALLAIPFNLKHEKSPSKIDFSQLFNQNSSFQFSKNRYSWQIEKSSHETVLTPSFATFRCQEKEPEEDKENSNKLPLINQNRKKTRIDKYFSRNDIVKERSEQLSKKDINFVEEITPRESVQPTKYKKVQPRLSDISRVKKACTKHDRITNNHSSKSFLYDNHDKSKLQQEMKEWALIKKKNEYEAFKLMRKNNYLRMKSNMIISQAMNELMDKREELLRREQSAKQIYIPLNQTDIASIRFSEN